jgi:PAS domain S-box-containing protein
MHLSSAILGIITDITDRKQTEEHIKQLQEYLQLQINRMPIGLITWDPEFRVQTWNPSAEKIFGFTEEEAQGKHPYDFIVPKEAQPLVDKIWRRLLKGDATAHSTNENATKDGRAIICDWSNTPLKKDDGTVMGVLSMIQDVTARKKTEEQIKASLKEKEVLLQEVHHRVKNNMQIISSLLNLQSRQIRDEQVLKTFKSSQNRVRSMALIHERLYSSKDFAKLDFSEYVKSLTSHLFSSYGVSQNAIKLNLKIKDIHLDLNTAIPCGLIINELISNSLKHAFPNGKKGEINIIMNQLNEDKIELIVSDNGAGIPKNVDIKKTESLGLHLVNILAEGQLHGEVKLDREKGTNFNIRLGVKK